jgi:hypothetical protein
VRQGDLVGVAVVRVSCAFPRFLSPMSLVVRSEILSVRSVGEVGSVLEVLEAVGEERPGRPGVVELVAASGLRGEHLARRPLLGRDLPLQGALEHLDLLPGHDDTSAFATQRRWVLVRSKAD